MNQTQSFPYVDDGQAQIVALPLADGQLSVLVALPHGDLATYEAGLGVTSAALSQPSSSTTVALSLPKATFTSPTLSLKPALSAMGMAQAFDGSAADFTGLSANDPTLYIHDVFHKAMVAMAETGVEAAAVTAVVFDDGGILFDAGLPVPMVVDRPYLVAIVDVPTGAILFLGHIGDPTDPGSP
jgi:serpin B